MIDITQKIKEVSFQSSQTPYFTTYVKTMNLEHVL